jgi:insulysin
VLGLIFSYLDHLRAAPFPADYYRDRARIAALNETYGDRGEGSELATQLANQALFYPLEVAERATAVWGAPDEAAYRRLLNVLTPDNLLVTLMAKGVPTDKAERIYGTAYSYREDPGAAYTALAQPAKVAFSLPTANRFMPTTTALLPERPLPLIAEPGLQLFYAGETEFLRPQTALIYRFVPVRAMATAQNAALLALYGACLNDALAADADAAALAGLTITTEATLEGVRVKVSGFGDSPVLYATHVATQLRTFTLTPARFDAVKDTLLRGLRSYPETEAYKLAQDRRDALSREFAFPPDELLAPATAATWADVQAFAQKFFATGRVEALVHGHLTPEAAVAATRTIAGKIGATAAPESALLLRRHIVLAAGEDAVDASLIAGVNSAFVQDRILPDDSPATRAAALVLSNFLSEPFYSELRTKQQLGYIVGANASASLRQRYFTFVIQASGYAPDDLRTRAEKFIATLPATLAALSNDEWTTLVAGARSTLEEKPKNIADKAESFFSLAYSYDGEWDRRQAALAALATLTKDQAAALLTQTLAPETARRRTILLHSKNNPPAAPIVPTFTDRSAWKAARTYQ